MECKLTKTHQELSKLLRAFSQKLLVLWALSTQLTVASFGNIVGSDHENFNIATGSSDYITSQSASTAGAGKFSLGISASHAKNSLPYFNESAYDAEGTSTLTSYEIFGNIGLSPFWDLYLSIPNIADQSTSNSGPHGEFATNGNLGIRAGTKINIINSTIFSLAASTDIYLDQTKDNPFSGRMGKADYSLQIIPELKFSWASLSTNLGYKWINKNPEKTATLPISPKENQVLASGAIKIPLSKKINFISEIYGTQTQGEFSDTSPRYASISEGLVGLKYLINNTLQTSVGYGKEIEHSMSSPSSRFFFGINWQGEAAEPTQKSFLRETTYEIIPDKTFIVSDILFKFNSAQLEKTQAFKELAKIGAAIKDKKGLRKLVIKGHTCTVGSAAYNQALSHRRAQSVKAFLVKYYHADPKKVATIGQGEASPIATNKTNTGRKQNRRVEFNVFYKR